SQAPGQIRSHSAFREIALCLVVRPGQLRLEESMSRRKSVEEFLPAFVARASRALRDRDAKTLSQKLDGFGKIEPIDLPDEMDDVPTRPASEAVVEPFVAVDGEGRSPFPMKRAEPFPGTTRLLQFGVLADDLDDVHGASQFRKHRIGDVQVAHRAGLQIGFQTVRGGVGEWASGRKLPATPPLPL